MSAKRKCEDMEIDRDSKRPCVEAKVPESDRLLPQRWSWIRSRIPSDIIESKQFDVDHPQQRDGVWGLVRTCSGPCLFGCKDIEDERNAATHSDRVSVKFIVDGKQKLKLSMYCSIRPKEKRLVCAESLKEMELAARAVAMSSKWEDDARILPAGLLDRLNDAGTEDLKAVAFACFDMKDRCHFARLKGDVSVLWAWDDETKLWSRRQGRALTPFIMSEIQRMSPKLNSMIERARSTALAENLEHMAKTFRDTRATSRVVNYVLELLPKYTAHMTDHVACIDATPMQFPTKGGMLVDLSAVSRGGCTVTRARQMTDMWSFELKWDYVPWDECRRLWHKETARFLKLMYRANGAPDTKSNEEWLAWVRHSMDFKTTETARRIVEAERVKREAKDTMERVSEDGESKEERKVDEKKDGDVADDHSPGMQAAVLDNAYWMTQFKQELYGYALTGCNAKKFFVFVYGPRGDNMKSTDGEIMRETFGEFYCSLQPKAILQPKGGHTFDNGPAQHDAHLMPLHNVRIAMVQETKCTETYRTDVIKRITGEQSLTVRGCGDRSTSTINMRAVVIIYGNEHVHLSPTDSVTMGRRLIFPQYVKCVREPTLWFERQMIEDVASQWRSSHPDHLMWRTIWASWCIEGAIRALKPEWDPKNPMQQPPLVVTAQKTARDDSETPKGLLEQFLNDKTEKSDTRGISMSDFRDEFKTYEIDMCRRRAKNNGLSETSIDKKVEQLRTTKDDVHRWLALLGYEINESRCHPKANGEEVKGTRDCLRGRQWKNSKKPDAAHTAT